MAVREGQIEWPDLARYSDAPVFNTKAVVQQTGVPAPTLRAWERRYTLLSPERANNTYRLYSERDIMMIHWLKERIDHGMSISQAIALFRHMQEEQQQIGATKKKADFPPIDPPTTPSASPQTEEPAPEKQESHALSFYAPDQSFMQNWSPTENDQHNYSGIYNMRLVQDRLIEAFQVLDDGMAGLLMASMFAIYPVEQVCLELITPTLWRIGQLWEQGKITVSMEHFASNFFRGLLSNLLHVTPSPKDGSLSIVCCAPGEPHELASLMLALFLRRAHNRVAYLGQSIEIEGLVQTVQGLSPALICVSVTMPAYLAALINLGKRIESLPEPRPIFTFGGQAFLQNSHLVSHVPGLYLQGNLQQVVVQLNTLLSKRSEKQN